MRHSKITQQAFRSALAETISTETTEEKATSLDVALLANCLRLCTSGHPACSPSVPGLADQHQQRETA
jgi:hypothetical protein